MSKQKNDFHTDNTIDEIPKNELFSSMSHLFGIIISIIGTTILITISAINESYIHILVFFIYGFSMILLYTMSTLYHIFPKDSKIKKLFRKFDHISIFLLIAGTYTPACVILLPKSLSGIILSIIWGLAVFGIIFKAIYVHSPGWFNGLIFVLMGWVAIFAIKPIYEALPINGFIILVLGGILYTIGAVIYAVSKKFAPILSMRMHDVFHIFILLGSMAHFWFMLKYIAIVNI